MTRCGHSWCHRAIRVGGRVIGDGILVTLDRKVWGQGELVLWTWGNFAVLFYVLWINLFEFILSAWQVRTHNSSCSSTPLSTESSHILERNLDVTKICLIFSLSCSAMYFTNTWHWFAFLYVMQTSIPFLVINPVKQKSIRYSFIQATSFLQSLTLAYHFRSPLIRKLVSQRNFILTFTLALYRWVLTKWTRLLTCKSRCSPKMGVPFCFGEGQLASPFVKPSWRWQPSPPRSHLVGFLLHFSSPSVFCVTSMLSDLSKPQTADSSSYKQKTPLDYQSIAHYRLSSALSLCFHQIQASLPFRLPSILC